MACLLSLYFSFFFFLPRISVLTGVSMHVVTLDCPVLCMHLMGRILVAGLDNGVVAKLRVCTGEPPAAQPAVRVLPSPIKGCVEFEL